MFSNDEQRPCNNLHFEATPIQAVDKQGHLSPTDQDDSFALARPDELSLGQALLHQEKAGAIIGQNLDRVRRTAPENEQMTAERVFAQHRLDLGGEAVDAPAQVGPARRQVDLNPVRQPDPRHLSRTASSRSSAPPSKLRLTRTTRPPDTTTSIRSSAGSGMDKAGSATRTVRNVGPASDAMAADSAGRGFSLEFQ